MAQLKNRSSNLCSPLLFLLWLLCVSGLASGSGLSADEQAWIEQHPVIRVGVTRSWAPFNFTDSQGNFSGIARDYFDLIEQNTGLSFEYIPETEKRNIEKIKSRQIDVLPILYKTEQRGEFLNFTSSYFELLDYFFVRDDLQVNSFADLDGLRLAIPEGYATIDVISRNFPEIELVLTESFADSIIRVLDGDADLLYDSYGAVTYSLRSMGINNVVPFKSISHLARGETHIGVRRDWPQLAAILEKGLKAISADQRRSIAEKWLGESGANTTSLVLTAQEQAWIAQHPVVSYGAELDWAPYDFQNSQGEHSGLSRQYLDAIADLTGLRFEPVFDSWANLMQLARQGEIQLLPALYFNQQRDKFLHFSDHYAEIIDYIFARSDLDLRYWDDLDGKTMAIPSGYLHSDLAVKHFPKIKLVETDTIEEAASLVESGKADLLLDAYSVITYLIRNEQFSNIVPLRPFDLVDSRKLHMAARDDNTLLIGIIDKALAAIPTFQRNQMATRWLSDLYQPPLTKLTLSDAEQSWLQQHPTIRFAGDPNWLPFEAFDEEGDYIGIVAEHLKLIEQKLGIRLQRVRTDNWKQTLELINTGQVDVFSETSDSLLNQAFGFTKSYLSSPIVIIMRDDESYINGLAQIKRQRIAMIEQYGYVNTIKQAYPEINFSTVASIQDGLTAVSTGKVDALVATLAQASYHMSAVGVNNIRIVGQTEFNTQLAFGIKPEFAPLLEMFNRAIKDIDQSEKQQILDDWGRYQFASRVDYVFIAKLVVGFLMVLAGVLFWNQRLARENRLRREAEAQTQALIDHLPLQVIVADRHGKILKANPKVLMDFDITEKELYSINLAHMFVSKSDAKGNFMHHLVSHGELSQQIFDVRYPQSERHSMMVSAIPFRYKKKKCFLVIGVDLSERLAMEEELLREKEKAEIANNAKSEFLANMSHEIRTPMNAILGFSELLSDQLKDRKLQTYVQTIRAAGNNLLLLINDILDLSKIEAGKMEIAVSAVNIHSLFDELETFFKLELARKGIDFVLDVEPGLPEYLILDLPRLRQILVNLLGNSVKFTDAGYVLLRVSAENKTADQTIDLKIEVEDSGIGIGPNQLDSIFEDFQQSEGQDHSRYGGTGLGLAISKRLANLMGGSLTVASALGEGTTFTLRLGAVSLSSEKTCQYESDHSSPVAVVFEPAVVLVVDDIADNRQLISENFSGTNLTIIEATNGREAVDLVQQQSVDLILMDLRMPVMSGYQAAELIKADFDIPIIAVTASVMKDELGRLKSEHFNGYVRKPVLKSELLNVLKSYLPYDAIEEDRSTKIELELTPRERQLIPELLGCLQELEPLRLQVERDNDLQETRLLAEKLHSLNQRFDFQPLQDISDTLLQKIDSFDINGIANELVKYADLVGSLSTLTD